MVCFNFFDKKILFQFQKIPIEKTDFKNKNLGNNFCLIQFLK